MAPATTNPYLRTKVMTASPAELRLLLLDGAIRFLEQGKAGLERKDYEASYDGISKCQNIVIELMNSLQPDKSPELCERLTALYTFMYTRLVTASTERDAAIAGEVLSLLEYERETWSLLMKKLAEENGAGAKAAPAVMRDAASVPAPTVPPAADGRLVGGSISVRG